VKVFILLTALLILPKAILAQAGLSFNGDSLHWSKIELAPFDGAFAFDGGDQAFIFGLRTSRYVTKSLRFETALSFIPREKAPSVWMVHGNLSYLIGQPRPGSFAIHPFATGGIGGTRFADEELFLSLNVGAGAKIITSPHFGFRVDFRQHFYRRGGEIHLDLEMSGGPLFRF